MNASIIRRKHTYSFRAWVDDWGFNDARGHEYRCLTHHQPCLHRRLWDLNWTKSGRNIIRIVRGQRRLTVRVGPRYWGFGR